MYNMDLTKACRFKECLSVTEGQHAFPFSATLTDEAKTFYEKA